MIYLDSSVALAHLLVEDRRPPESLWNETLVSSRLLEYELWTPVHSRGLAGSHGEAVRLLIGRISMPGRSMGQMNQLMPRCRGASGSVLARSIP